MQKFSKVIALLHLQGKVSIESTFLRMCALAGIVGFLGPVFDACLDLIDHEQAGNVHPEERRLSLCVCVLGGERSARERRRGRETEQRIGPE